jgi:hypothetical protein
MEPFLMEVFAFVALVFQSPEDPAEILGSGFQALNFLFELITSFPEFHLGEFPLMFSLMQAGRALVEALHLLGDPGFGFFWIGDESALAFLE